MKELEITFGRAARIWWAWTWRTMLLSILIGGVIGFVAGFIGAVLGFKPASGMVFLLGGGAGALVGIWIMTKILKKKYSDFRIALIGDDDFVR